MKTELFRNIQPLWSTFPTGETSSKEKTTETGGMFGEILQNAVENVKTTDAEKNKAEYLLATGQLDNPAELTIATTKAQLSVDLLVQLRNKALDAYSELNRLSL
ncbi:MAG: flagellar hook-basal body complex protein FliE [Oscillibacter sp.]|nr:flagellar hook-basal body complex protein FliE [Oscillibacter sp.]